MPRPKTKTTTTNARSQLPLALKPRFGWGGARAGAGRPRSGRAGVPHRARPLLAARHPVHMTLRAVRGLPNLRSSQPFKSIRGAIRAGCERFGFRVVHFSVQANHFHFIVEAADETSLSKGATGLQVRIARALNTLFRRRGRLFADRYHAHVLETPREVRHALAYVLLNARKHARQNGQPMPRERFDPCSSARCFDGWCVSVEIVDDPPLASARTWLLRVGWRRSGLLSPSEVPSSRVARPS